MEVITNFILIVSGSALGGFIFKLFDKLIDEFLNSRRLSSGNKRLLATNVLKICTEAKKADFNTPPRDYEHCLFITNSVKIRDERMGLLMEGLLSAWKMSSFIYPRDAEVEIEMGLTEKELIPVHAKMQKIAKENYEELLRLIKKWQ